MRNLREGGEASGILSAGVPNTLSVCQSQEVRARQVVCPCGPRPPSVKGQTFSPSSPKEKPSQGAAPPLLSPKVGYFIYVHIYTYMRMYMIPVK